MDNLAERYIRLSRAYIKLADKFQKLDVEHMALRGKVVPLLKAIKTHRSTIDQLNEENLTLKHQLTELIAQRQRIKELEAQLETVTAHYETLKPLAGLLQPEVEELLTEVEEQLELVDATFDEIDSDRDPDLSESDKEILQEYENDPAQFTLSQPRYTGPTVSVSTVQPILG
jgi:predicted  nucleic acid-binding Zn-ribbon protein